MIGDKSVRVDTCTRAPVPPVSSMKAAEEQRTQRTVDAVHGTFSAIRVKPFVPG